MRKYWIQTLVRIIEPVLKNLSEGTLHQNMPVESMAGCSDERQKYSHLEALGRALTGAAPWLASDSSDPWEIAERNRMATLAQAAIDAATDPSSPDFCNFEIGAQPLVDTAFLPLGLSPTAPFWSAPDEPWSWKKRWNNKQI